MKRLLLSILILMVTASLADASGVIKRRNQAAAPDTCTSPTADVSITSNQTSSTFYSGQDRGQSWKAGASGELYSLTFRRYYESGDAESLTIRVGTSSDLSTTYLKEFSCTVPAASGTFECAVPTPRPALTSGTTYYAIMAGTSSWSIRRSSTDVYADGTAFYDTTQDFSGTAAANDLYFITKMCD